MVWALTKPRAKSCSPYAAVRLRVGFAGCMAPSREEGRPQVRRPADRIQHGEDQDRQRRILEHIHNYSERIPMAAIILPVWPNSARCEKKRAVSQAVQPSMTVMFSSETPASSS